MKTVVTITPASVVSDSRTFKQASAVSQFGLNSVVIEGERSDVGGKELPFKLISPKKIQEMLPISSDSHGDSKVINVRGLAGRIYDSAIFKTLMMPFYVLYYFFKYDLHVLLTWAKGDLYYLHSPTQFISVFILSRFHRVSYIYDAHDFYSRIEDRKRCAATSWYWLFIESLCIKYAAEVVTVSDGLKELYPKQFARNAIVLRNLHDHRIDCETSRDIKSELNLAPGDFLIVVVGTHKKGQAFEEILSVVKELPEQVHLATLGHGYEKHKARIDEENLSSRIHIVPPVKPYEVVPFIKSADLAAILYYPYSQNYSQCLPNGFFQSIAAGIPLLYPPLPEISKIAEKYGVGLQVDPRSKEALKDAVIRMLESKTLYSQFKANSEKAANLLTWENEEGLLMELILEHS